MSNFKDLTVYNGIDVHANQWNVVIYAGRNFHKQFQQPPTGKALSKYLHEHFPGATYKSVYEAGCLGFQPHRELVACGIQNIVVNPADVPTTHKDTKRKRDARDARRLAKSLVHNMLEGIYIPTVQQEADRKLIRYRTTTVRKNLTKCKQRIKDLLTKQGKKIPTQWRGNCWNNSFIEWLTTLDFSESSNRTTLDILLADLDHAKKQMRRLNKEITELSRSPQYRDVVKWLSSIPGIGVLTAMVIVTELIDIHRFKTLDQLCSYAGIAPDVRSSDQREKVSGLTKRANNELRRMLVQASWIAKSKDPDLLVSYQKLCERMKAQKAIIRIARKLLSRVRYVWRNECEYVTP